MSTTSDVSAMSDLDYSSQEESDAEDDWSEKREHRQRRQEEESRTTNQCTVQLQPLAVQTLLLTVTLQKSWADLRRNMAGGEGMGGEGHSAWLAESMGGGSRN